MKFIFEVQIEILNFINFKITQFKLKVERKAIKILEKSYEKAKRIIKHYQLLIVQLTKMLMDKTVLVAEETNSIFEKYGL